MLWAANPDVYLRKERVQKIYDSPDPHNFQLLHSDDQSVPAEEVKFCTTSYQLQVPEARVLTSGLRADRKSMSVESFYTNLTFVHLGLESHKV